MSKKRSISASKEGDSSSDSDAATRRAKQSTIRKLRSTVAECLKQMNEPLVVAFSEEYTVDIAPVPWIANLPTHLLCRVLCAEDPLTHKYVLDFGRLTEIASCSKLTYMLFFVDVPGEPEPTNLWYHLIKQWLPRKENGELMRRKFSFLHSFIDKNWFKNAEKPEIKALEAYLNRFGAGYCEHCTMFTNIHMKTDQTQDLIPISPFRLLTQQEEQALKGGYDDSKLIRPFAKDPRNLPTWLRAMLALRNVSDTHYCCVNCKTLLNQQIFGIAIPSIFEACARRSARKKKDELKDPNLLHVWLELPNELTRPLVKGANGKPKKREVIPGQYEYCARCGLLRFEGQKDQVDEELCPDCHKPVCECERCEFCNGLAGCDCIICDYCNRCQTGCTRRCKDKGCRCKESSSEPSIDDDDSSLMSSSDSSSGQAQSSSESDSD